MNTDLPNYYDTNTLQTQYFQNPDKKVNIAGDQNGREISQKRDVSLVNVWELIIRCFDWKSRDMLHLSLTCKSLKQIVYSHPNFCLHKVLCVIEKSPLNYCEKEPHERLVQFITSLLSSIKVLPNDKFSEEDIEHFRERHQNAFPTLMRASFPPPFIPLIVCCVRNRRLRLNQEVAEKLNPDIKTADDENESKWKAWETLTKDPVWTTEKMESVDWSFLVKGQYQNSNWPLFLDPKWWDSVKKVHQETKLSKACLFWLFNAARDFDRLVENAYADEETHVEEQFYDTFMADKCDDEDFMREVMQTFGSDLFEKCSERLKKDRKFVLDAVQNIHADIFRTAYAQFGYDKEFLSAAARNPKHDDDIWEDTDGLENELQTNGEALLQFCQEYGVEKFPESFSLSLELANDEDLMKKLVEHNPHTLPLASPELRKKTTLTLLSIQRHGQNVIIPDELQDDEKFIKEHVKEFDWIITKASKRLLNQPDMFSFMQVYIEKTGDFSFVPFSHPMGQEKDIALKALEKQAKAVLYLDKSLRNDHKFMIEAVYRNPLVILELHHWGFYRNGTGNSWNEASKFEKASFILQQKLLRVRHLYLRLLRKLNIQQLPSWCALNDSKIPNHFRKDREIVLAAIKLDPKMAKYVDPALLAQEDFISELLEMGLPSKQKMENKEIVDQEKTNQKELEESLNSPLPKEMEREADAKIKQKQWKEADILLTQVLNHYGFLNAFTELLFKAATIKSNLKNHQEADILYTQALQRCDDPAPKPLLLNAALVKSKLAQWKEADSLFKQLMITPEYQLALILALAAFVKEQLGQLEKANTLYLRATEKYGDQVPPWVHAHFAFVKLAMLGDLAPAEGMAKAKEIVESLNPFKLM